MRRRRTTTWPRAAGGGAARRRSEGGACAAGDRRRVCLTSSPGAVAPPLSALSLYSPYSFRLRRTRSFRQPRDTTRSRCVGEGPWWQWRSAGSRGGGERERGVGKPAGRRARGSRGGWWVRVGGEREVAGSFVRSVGHSVGQSVTRSRAHTRVAHAHTLPSHLRLEHGECGRRWGPPTPFSHRG